MKAPAGFGREWSDRRYGTFHSPAAPGPGNSYHSCRAAIQSWDQFSRTNDQLGVKLYERPLVEGR